MSIHKFPYKWTIKDSKFTKDKGKVFSCFACGGGSTMGYKLAGFDVIGCNEIDPKLIKTYIDNHHPVYAFNEPIQTFKNKEDLPSELFELDILDGSPPCSSYSVAGNREDDWGKEKKFREGQTDQVLDTLFFDFIDLAKRLQPKIVIAENVKGLLMGNAKAYVTRIMNELDKAGYVAQYKLLDASTMGIPQKRERVFFIALRKDLCDRVETDPYALFDYKPLIDLEFNETPIPFSEISQNDIEFDNTEWVDIWKAMKQGDSLDQFVGYGFNTLKVYNNQPLPTIAGTQRKGSFKSAGLIHPTQCRKLNDMEFCLGGSFPIDYDFSNYGRDTNYAGYVIGMSVPPVMTAQIASRIYDQWLSKINKDQK